jgi:WD40 repeat protein
LAKAYTFAGHITAVAFNDDDTYVAASILGMDDTLWLRDNAKDQARSFKGQRQVAGMAFTKDSQMLLTMDDNGTIAFWNVSTEHQGEHIGRDFKPPHYGNMFWMAFDRSGGRLATADEWGRVVLYRADWLLRGCDRLHDLIDTGDLPAEDAVRIPLNDRKKLTSFCEAYTNENAKQ